MNSKMEELYGYAGQILRVDLSSGTISSIPTEKYATRFIGGRGMAAKIYWDEVDPQIDALSPENRLIFVTGPMTGFKGVGASRFQVCGKSPAADPECFSYSNLGGSWGPRLKHAGYDVVILQGASDRPVYLLIKDGAAEIRDASSLWGKSTIEVQETLKKEFGRSLSVLSCGQAGENMVSFASLLADDDSSASSGFGAVMGSKKLKAVAVQGGRKPSAFDPLKLQELTRYVQKLKRLGQRSIAPLSAMFPDLKLKPCYGCTGCIRARSRTQDNTMGKVLCGSATFYLMWAKKYYGEWNDVPFFADRLCDSYGIDTHALISILGWLDRCFQEGIITEETTGLPLSQMGSLEFIEMLVKKIAFREGFGDVLAKGTFKAARIVGGNAETCIENHLPYDPRLYITTGLFYATEPRTPFPQLHEIGLPIIKWVEWINKSKNAVVSGDVIRAIAEKFWKSELAVDYATYDGKAQCAKMIQDRTYAKECLGLCDFFWPVLWVQESSDHVGDPSLESKLFSAVTGRDMDEEGLYQTGEQIFNLQRAILAREGRQGREHDRLPEFCFTQPQGPVPFNPECLVPGKGDEVISRKGAMLDPDEFERIQTEYYELRGWDPVSGFQTKTKLHELGLGDIAQALEQEELIV